MHQRYGKQVTTPLSFSSSFHSLSTSLFLLSLIPFFFLLLLCSVKFRLCEGKDFQFELYDWTGSCIFSILFILPHSPFFLLLGYTSQSSPFPSLLLTYIFSSSSPLSSLSPFFCFPLVFIIFDSDKYRFGASEPVISIDPIGPKCYVFGMESVEWIDVGGNDIKYIRMAGDDENLCLGTVSFRNGYPLLHSLLFFFLFFLLFLSFQI